MNKYSNKKALISILIVMIMVLSAFLVVTPNSRGLPTSSNASSNIQVSTDLGNNVALVAGSIGITLPNAINSNYTKSPGVVAGTIAAENHAVIGEQLLFSISGTNGGLPPYTYVWTFYSVNNIIDKTLSGQSAYYAFNHAGIHKVMVTAKDSIGNTNSTVTYVNVYNPLTISVEASTPNVYIGEPVTFTYSISGGSGAYQVTYNLGNGVIGSIPSPLSYTAPPTGSVQTIYTKPGKYLAVFEVNDAAGLTSTRTYWVNVSIAQTNATIAPLSVYSVLNTIPYATTNITSIPEGTQLYDTLYVSGGTGWYNYTVIWGDGNISYYSSAFTDNSNPVFSHTYTAPALYYIDVYVNDSLGTTAFDRQYIQVKYVPPSVVMGYTLPPHQGNSSINATYANFTVTFIRVSTTNASEGVGLWGNITNGKAPYKWTLYNTTKVLASGTYAHENQAFFLYTFTTTIPGTYHFQLNITDQYGNNATAEFTVIVVSQYLQVELKPNIQSPVGLGTHVQYYVYLYNITANASGDANVTVVFNNGTIGTAAGNVTIHLSWKGLTPYSINYVWPNNPLNITINIDKGTPRNATNVTYHVQGTFTAFATANYGTTYNNSPAAPYYFTEATYQMTVLPLKAISYTPYWTPYPPTQTVGSPINVSLNITGGNGYYVLNITNIPGITITIPITETGVTKYTGTKYTYLNVTNPIWISSENTWNFNVTFTLNSDVVGKFLFTSTLHDPSGLPKLSMPFDFNFQFLPPKALKVTLEANSHYSYADYTTFTAYLNISGSAPPYSVNVYFGGWLEFLHVYENNNKINSYYYPVNSFTITTQARPAKFTFVGEYVSIPSYALSNHQIMANVTSSYPFGHPYFINLSYDEYAIPYIQTSIHASSSTGQAPTVISFNAPTLYGELPNMQNYTYHWILENIAGVTLWSATTTTSAISIPFNVPGTYYVYVTVYSPNGEFATAYTIITITPPEIIGQVVSVRAMVTLTGPSGNTYIAYAGPVDWNQTGAIMASFAMPNVPSVNAVYTMNVSYSLTIAITQYDYSSTHPGWETYFYNAYSPVPYASTQITVVAGGVLVNIGQSYSQIEAQISGVWNTLNVSSSNLQSALSSGFKTVNGNLVTIQTQGSEILTNITTINGELSSISGNVATITSDIGTIQTSLSSINAQITSINGNIATIKTDIGTIQTNISKINAQITSINNGIATIQTTVGTISTTLSSINAQITSINGNIATIKTDIGTIQTSLSSIGATVTTTSNNVNTLVGTTATIQTDVGTISGTVTAVNGTVATINTKLGTVQANIGTLSSSVSSTMGWMIGVLVLVIITLVLVLIVILQVSRISKQFKPENKTPEEKKEGQ